MGAFSSINFKKSTSWQIYHNSDIRPSYAIGGKLECNRNAAEALNLRQEMIDSAFERYTARTGQKPQAKSYEWSAVVNLKPDTTMADLDKLAQHFQNKYGFQCYQIAIHRDEGHINELGEKVINHHAHLEFVTLDRETGKNRFRRAEITPQVLRNIQDEVAEILQMERGVDKRLSGAKRIEPRAYAAMKEKEKLERAELVRENERLKGENADLAAENTKAKRIIKKARSQNATLKAAKNAEFEKQRKEWVKEGGHTAEDYQALSRLKKACGEANLTIEQVTERINQFVARQKAESEQREQSRADRVSSATYFYNPDSRGSTPNGIVSQTPKETILSFEERMAATFNQAPKPQPAQKQEIPQAPRELTPTPQTPQSVEISQNKTINQDIKEVLEELGINAQRNYYAKIPAICTNGYFTQTQANQIREKLELRKYFVAIGRYFDHFEIAFAKTKEKLSEVCKKVAYLWDETIYQTQERQDRGETKQVANGGDAHSLHTAGQAYTGANGVSSTLSSATQSDIIPQPTNQPKDNLDNQTPQEKMRARVSETLCKQNEPKRKQDDLER